jgi:hypothetical protein
MTSDNPFLDLADRQLSAPVKSRQKAAATRRARTAAEKKLEEEQELSKMYMKLRRETINQMLDGPFGGDIRRVQRFLRVMTIESAPDLVEFVRREAHWMKAQPIEHQYLLLKLLGNGITRVRERAGLSPFDDGLPGDSPKAFETIKQILGLK